MNAMQRSFLVGKMGEERVGVLEARLSEMNKDFAEAGVRFKASLDDQPVADGGGGAPPADEPKKDDAPVTTDDPAGDDPAAADADDEDGDGDADDGAKAIIAAVREVITPLATAVEELSAWRKSIESAPTAEQRLADMIRPRVGPLNGAASDSAEFAGRGKTKAEKDAEAIVAAAQTEDGSDDSDPMVRAAMPFSKMLTRAAASGTNNVGNS